MRRVLSHAHGGQQTGRISRLCRNERDRMSDTLPSKPGTPKSEILKKLPSIVTLIGEDGSELELTGEWDCPDYSKNAEGRYTFEFSKKVTGKAQDRYSLLKAYVTVADGSENPAPGEDSGDSQSSGTSEQAPKSGGMRLVCVRGKYGRGGPYAEPSLSGGKKRLQRKIDYICKEERKNDENFA